MHPVVLSAVVAVALFSATAQAQTLVATSNIIVRALDRTLDFTSDTTTSVRDSKVVLAARDDAASFRRQPGADPWCATGSCHQAFAAKFLRRKGASDSGPG